MSPSELIPPNPSNRTPDDPRRRAFDAALDAALARALAPPPVPVQLRARVHAAVARDPDPRPGIAAVRRRLEQEHQERLAALDQQYIRLRRRTLGTMVGGAFAAGAAAALALPWLTAHVGTAAPAVIATASAAVALWLGISAWLASRQGLRV